MPEQKRFHGSCPLLVSLLLLVQADASEAGPAMIAPIAVATAEQTAKIFRDFSAFSAIIPLNAAHSEALNDVATTVAKSAAKTTLRLQPGDTLREALTRHCALEILDAYLRILPQLDPETAASLDARITGGTEMLIPTCPTPSVVVYQVSQGDTLYDLWRATRFEEPAGLPLSFDGFVPLSFQDFQVQFERLNSGIVATRLPIGRAVRLPVGQPALIVDAIVPKAAFQTVQSAVHKSIRNDFVSIHWLEAEGPFGATWLSYRQHRRI